MSPCSRHLYILYYSVQGRPIIGKHSVRVFDDRHKCPYMYIYIPTLCSRSLRLEFDNSLKCVKNVKNKFYYGEKI